MDKETIKSLKEKVKKLEKLVSTKTEIVSISAHQIRTSLSALRWIIKMFLDGDLGKLTVDQEELIQKAYEDNIRAIGIVSELLLANKTEDIEEKKYNFEITNMVELIDDSIFDFSGETHNHEVEIIFLKPENRFSTVLIDKEKIRIVLQNLLENAIKYSEKEGKIFIALKEEKDFVEFSIKNTGTEISEEGKNKIFEKFYRDTEAQKKGTAGTGIGLFTAKKIIEGHNGKIWFSARGGSASGRKSLKNNWTTFTFTLPVSQSKK